LGDRLLWSNSAIMPLCSQRLLTNSASKNCRPALTGALGNATSFTYDEKLERIARQVVNLLVEEKLNDVDTLRICVSVTGYLAAIAGAEAEAISRTVRTAVEEHKRALAVATPRA
jgi:hypothetical protein